MPKIDLTLTLSWKGLEIETLECGNKAVNGQIYRTSISVKDKNDFDVASDVQISGMLPEGWDELLSRLPAFEMETDAIPSDGLCKARYYLEHLENCDAACKEWLSYTYPTWCQTLKDENPDARGFPSKNDLRHVKASIRSLMMLMNTLDIHDVLYADKPILSWDWKQQLLHALNKNLAEAQQETYVEGSREQW